MGNIPKVKLLCSWMGQDVKHNGHTSILCEQTASICLTDSLGQFRGLKWSFLPTNPIVDMLYLSFKEIKEGRLFISHQTLLKPLKGWLRCNFLREKNKELQEIRYYSKFLPQLLYNKAFFSYDGTVSTLVSKHISVGFKGLFEPIAAEFEHT